MKRSYRYEQGFTYELHVRGVADEQRAAFVEKRAPVVGHEGEGDGGSAAEGRTAMADKRTTVDEMVAELRSGHDRRLRRLGFAPQAHGGGAGHLPLRPRAT